MKNQEFGKDRILNFNLIENENPSLCLMIVWRGWDLQN
jgi:hypothetical protein